jgi:hypothetical protein
MTITSSIPSDTSSYISRLRMDYFKQMLVPDPHKEEDSPHEKTNSLLAPPNDFEYSECTITENNRKPYCIFNLPAISDNVIIKLDDLYNECREPNWDGYNSESISTDYFKDAKLFLMKLIKSIGIDDINKMEISPAPDGTILYEWYGVNNNILSVWLRKNNSVAYSFILLNENKHEMIDLGNEDGYKNIYSIINNFLKKNDLY